MSGVYTVAMIPVTAAAKRETVRVDLEYEADTASAAIEQAVSDCQWRNPWDNFAWRIIGRRVTTPEPHRTTPGQEEGIK